MTALKYLQAYPIALQQQVRQLIDEQRLGDYLSQRYPGRHAIQSDKALYSYALELKQEYLRNAPAIDKVLFDNRLDLTHRALGLHTTVSRVQGGKLKAKKEIRIASLFKEAAPEFAPGESATVAKSFLTVAYFNRLESLARRLHGQPAPAFFALEYCL